ncbi:MAG: hypothetical protein QOF57_412 [Frankiaceae bacterium]|jgi:deazaflavin-dependent oxidoreductase (nitroreductase family)|nr:hypothetical protein [Frankiaceae bacterium]MDQ1726747.1 hypothetical protein [Frankiaceae bacterium]
MAENWNDKVIAEFRTNRGEVGGNFGGSPLVLLHHVGRSSGKGYVAPVMYRRADDPDTIHVFASKGGHPEHPDWYRNLVAAGTATIELGAETFPVTVTEVTGDERDRIYAAQVADFPGFGDYEEKTAGIRTIPVLQLTRVR